MARLELLDFQQAAANQLVESALGYFGAPGGPDIEEGRVIPFVGQLKAVTGAGKTPILASVVGRLAPAIVLWTTKFGSVVDQTAANLRSGGKYHHLLGGGSGEVIKFSDIPSPDAWRRILNRDEGLTILISTVAAWYTSEKDERLNVHRVAPDWGEKSRWDQLKEDRQRPLWVVYDEAHNTTTEQIELLDELEPNGFFVASASPIKGRLQGYLTNRRGELRKGRVVPVSTRAVVDAQLLKSTISLADYDSSSEEMIGDVVHRRASLEQRLAIQDADTVPKAIYVVETSNPVKGQEPRPVTIWKTLVQACGVDLTTIAVCTNTKELPKDAIRVQAIDQLSDRFTHIIFNKKLQEGWDDPSVYVCYFDGKTDSATRIQQVLGRALRQPNAAHLADEDLNTAYFFINCPNETLEKITDQLMDELRIYKGPEDPDDFEPVKVKEERRAPGKIAVKPEWTGKLRVPRLQIELPAQSALERLVEQKSFEFSAADRSAPGRALINIVSVRTGDVTQNTRDLYEDMRVHCGAYLHEQIRALSRDCANAIPPKSFTSERLNQTACYHSRALNYYRELAAEIVTEYERRVQLGLFVDPDEVEYVVGPYQPSDDTRKAFAYAGHPYYDLKAFNEDEREFARALDKLERYVWVRNKDRLDYYVPLPIKSGSSARFFPDFLWWVKDTVWAIDPTGKFLLEEKVRTKLLQVPPPLRIALVTRGKHQGDRDLRDGGWTLMRHRLGNVMSEPFDTLDDLLATLITES